MIGQKENLETITKWRLNKAIPRFTIIEGEEGSGRLTLAKKIIEMLNATGVIIGIGKDEIRETIENAYKVQSTTVYIIRNADDMNVSAKNSLLKLVEEPPNKAYFIMTLKDANNTLATIRSRGTLLKMAPYSTEELRNFTTDETILRYFNTPNACMAVDVKQVEKIKKVVMDTIDGIVAKSGTKVLKSCTQLSNKADDGKIDCNLFYSIFKVEYLTYAFNNNLLNPEIIRLLFAINRDMNVTSINKKSCIECTLLTILNIYKEQENAEIS